MSASAGAINFLLKAKRFVLVCSVWAAVVVVAADAAASLGVAAAGAGRGSVDSVMMIPAFS